MRALIIVDIRTTSAGEKLAVAWRRAGPAPSATTWPEAADYHHVMATKGLPHRPG